MPQQRTASSHSHRQSFPESDPAIEDEDVAAEFESSASQRNPSRFKIIASLLILFHLAAVALPPLAFQTFSLDGPSPLVGNLMRPFAGYSQFLHMDRGYAFFAPNPPRASHLIQVASTRPDGSISERMIPDRNDQWPRLLYHRHFMLSEYLNEAYWPPGPPDDLFESDRAAAELWQQRRGRYEYLRQSMVDHLRSENGGREVAIRRIEHGLPGLQDFVVEPIELTDPRLYSVLLDQPIFSDEIAPAPAATEEIPAPILDDSEQSETTSAPVVESDPQVVTEDDESLAAEPRS